MADKLIYCRFATGLTDEHATAININIMIIAFADTLVVSLLALLQRIESGLKNLNRLRGVVHTVPMHSRAPDSASFKNQAPTQSAYLSTAQGSGNGKAVAVNYHLSKIKPTNIIISSVPRL